MVYHYGIFRDMCNHVLGLSVVLKWTNDDSVHGWLGYAAFYLGEASGVGTPLCKIIENPRSATVSHRILCQKDPKVCKM